MASVIPYISNNNNSRIAIINHNKMIKEYHLVIHDYLNKNNLKIIDYILIYNILVVTLNQFLDEETFITIPIIDKLQQLKKEGVCVEEQIVYQSVLLKYIENIVLLLKNDSLKQYIKELKDERKNNGHWVELNYELKDIYGYKNKSFKDLSISPNATPVIEFMDYKKINEYTNFDEELYRQYPELKEKGTDISFKDILEIVTDNKNYKKTNSITLDSKHIRLTSISIPQL